MATPLTICHQKRQWAERLLAEERQGIRFLHRDFKRELEAISDTCEAVIYRSIGAVLDRERSV